MTPTREELIEVMKAEIWSDCNYDCDHTKGGFEEAADTILQRWGGPEWFYPSKQEYPNSDGPIWFITTGGQRNKGYFAFYGLYGPQFVTPTINYKDTEIKCWCYEIIPSPPPTQ